MQKKLVFLASPALSKSSLCKRKSARRSAHLEDARRRKRRDRLVVELHYLSLPNSPAALMQKNKKKDCEKKKYASISHLSSLDSCFLCSCSNAVAFCRLAGYIWHLLALERCSGIFRDLSEPKSLLSAGCEGARRRRQTRRHRWRRCSVNVDAENVTTTALPPPRALPRRPAPPRLDDNGDGDDASASSLSTLPPQSRKSEHGPCPRRRLVVAHGGPARPLLPGRGLRGRVRRRQRARVRRGSSRGGSFVARIARGTPQGEGGGPGPAPEVQDPVHEASPREPCYAAWRRRL